jgi:parallel beta-helix repeat protein
MCLRRKMMKLKLFSIILVMTLILGLSGISPVQALPQAATYIVNSDTGVADNIPGDGICATPGGNCTLHAAIQEANLDGVASVINFASKFQGIHAIPGCSLPYLTENNTTIDGSARWDVANDRPGVEITDSACNLLKINSSGNNVYGILLGGGASTGVHIMAGGNNNIGGSASGQRNVYLVGKYGVYIQSPGTNNQVRNSYFGTVTGESIPGGGGEVGVFVQAGDSNSVIANNLIVGQTNSGILLWANGNSVSNNVIGVTWNKQSALPNNYGVQLYGDNNIVDNGNVIAGNSDHGVYVYHADNNTISHNFIGYPFSVNDLGNGGDGIHVHASANNKIEDGNVISDNNSDGIHVNGSSNTQIWGNGISGNDQNGVYIVSSDGEIGGVGTSKLNDIGGNKGNGIHLDSSSNVRIVNNHIGLSSGAFDAGNGGHGVLINNASSGNTVGGDSSNEGNWIGWNHQSGIHISGSGTDDNYVLNNTIGAPVNWGWEAPNGNHGIGIYDGANGNRIGGFGAGNIILSSGWSGVVMHNSANNAVVANRIGTNGSGVNWGNTYYGVHIVSSPLGNAFNNAISFNEIAYSGTHNGLDLGEAGVSVDGAVNNTISQNSIHDNDGPGIQLVNGGNGALAAPTISNASCQGPVSGKAGGPGWIIEIFSDIANEGRRYEGNAIANTSGNWSWNGNSQGPKITATARTSANDTSAFSTPFDIGRCIVPSIFLPLMYK